ncbi:hypothetical protein [Prosthecobacter sp.]|uniref:hypothetical protein n=1 Tax=Prosthecobacter sp. TaxID=1965333 RepID=UPI003784CE23
MNILKITLAAFLLSAFTSQGALPEGNELEINSLLPKAEDVVKMTCNARVIKRDVKKMWLFNGEATDRSAYESLLAALEKSKFKKMDMSYGGINSAESCIYKLLMKDGREVDVTIYGARLVSIGKSYYSVVESASNSKINFSHLMYLEILKSRKLWAKYVIKE